MSLAKQITSLEERDFGPFRAGIVEAQTLIPKAGRFQVDQAVMDAVERMERTPLKDLLTLLNRAKLPHSPTWIEWVKPNGGGHIGYLCEGLPDAGFAFRQFGTAKAIKEMFGTPLVCTLGRVRVQPAGWIAEDKGDEASAIAEQGQNFLELAACDILCLLLMINSPSQILEIDAGADNQDVDAKRARQGRPPLANWRPIRFDISRFQQAGFVNGERPANQREVAEHFVRGHFKVRKSGLFWWSPYVRNQMGETAVAVPRDYIVANTQQLDSIWRDGDD